MRYWHPFIGVTLKEMYEDGIRECIVLSLYPHYSIATTGSAYKELKRCLEQYPIDCVYADPWYNNSKYIGALFQSVAEMIQNKETVVDILYSAHSLPESFIEAGDPYVDHIKETIRLVNDALAENGYRFRSHLSYQSRSGPVKWLSPSTDEKILELSRVGVKDLIAVPISFVSDHIETLYEIDILYRELASEHGIALRRSSSMNTDPAFIEALRGMVLKYV
jgi:ferrochelatase